MERQRFGTDRSRDQTVTFITDPHVTQQSGTPPRSLIAIVLPNMGGGGAERVHLELAREFVALGHDVEFVLMRAEGQLIADLPPSVSVVGLGVSNFRYALGPLRRYFQQRQPASVIAAMWPLTAMTVLAARTVRQRPRVLVGEHIHFGAGPGEHRLSMLTMKWLGRIIYGSADTVICVSAGARTALASITGFPEERIEVVYNPVRPPAQISAMPDTGLTTWWQAANYRLVTAGRLTTQKDQATLLHAMACLPSSLDARLLILGDGPERDNLKALIDTLGLQDRVRLGGFVDVPAFLNHASLLVLSSRWEGLGVILVEALLQGVPVVSTDCPSGPAEVLENGRYGRLVPVQDPEALAAAIAATLASPSDPIDLKARGAIFEPRNAAIRYLQLLAHPT